ncbi:MAG TPA: two-component regulator propeller domain-containing protein, partial [Bacteroidales bacterium]|nr:two-component regulator propeller domain-containing protein [Bacteroidales bacterium]
MKILYSTTGCLFLFSVLMNGQTFSFKNFGAESNIPSAFVYTINQSNDGFLWVGTGNGIARFDGFNFILTQYPDSVTSRIATVSLKDDNGTIWFGCSDGTVFYVKNNTLVGIPIENSKSISDLVEGPDGMIYIIPQGKPVYTIDPGNPEKIKKHSLPSDPVMLSASFT